MGNLMRRRPGGQSRGRKPLLAVAASVLVLAAAGCGSDDAEGDSESSESSDSIVDLETIDDAAVQETVNKALLTDAVPLRRPRPHGPGGVPSGHDRARRRPAGQGVRVLVEHDLRDR